MLTYGDLLECCVEIVLEPERCWTQGFQLICSSTNHQRCVKVPKGWAILTFAVWGEVPGNYGHSGKSGQDCHRLAIDILL